jgi:DNA-binding response OmpR family regulator
VVDDDAAIRRIVKSSLESAGYTVMMAADGAVGLAFFKQHQPAIGLLLTDVAMPNMNGRDLADHVLELDGTLPVLFMSGTVPGADRGYGCVEKPFRSSELLARVGAALQRPS